MTKDTLGKLVKMDSFLREAGRFNSTSLSKLRTLPHSLHLFVPQNILTTIRPVGLARTARKKFIFEDGTVIPAGAKVGAPLYNLHNDPRIYENPEVFDGFRFSRLREKSQGALRAAKHQMVTTELDYLPFGHGKHAWYVPIPTTIFLALFLEGSQKLTCTYQSRPILRCERDEIDLHLPPAELRDEAHSWNEACSKQVLGHHGGSGDGVEDLDSSLELNGSGTCR